MLARGPWGALLHNNDGDVLLDPEASYLVSSMYSQTPSSIPGVLDVFPDPGAVPGQVSLRPLQNHIYLLQLPLDQRELHLQGRLTHLKEQVRFVSVKVERPVGTIHHVIM